MSLRLTIVIAAVSCSACTAVNVRSVDQARHRPQHVCIQENSKVIIGDFLDVVRTHVERHGLTTEVYRTDRTPAQCEYTLTYTARQSWDFSPYLSVALIELRRGSELVSRGDYRLRGKGGLSLMKWQGTEAKIGPVIDEMFGTLTGVVPPAAAASPVRGRFEAAQFNRIAPGVTTREQIAGMFGPPDASKNMGAGMLVQTWNSDTQIVSAVFLDNVFSHLESLANVPLSDAERRRLGL